MALVIGVALARAATNNIGTAAGTGTSGFSGDNGAATAAQISTPVGVARTADRGYLIVDQGNNRIRRVSPAGVITTVAGNGTAGFGGDNGPATSAQLNAPNGAAPTADGGFLFADSNNNRVRRVSPSGVITTVAGTGAAGFSGDNGPATSAQLSFPGGVAVLPDGSYLITDNDNNRVRRVSPAGTITTVAGTGGAGAGGDNGPATGAQLNDPPGSAGTGDGGYLIGDTNNNKVRRVSPGGTITTVAGTGAAGFSGDNGPATSAQLNSPLGVAATSGNDFLIADTSNHRIRIVDAGDPPPLPPPPPPPPPPPESAQQPPVTLDDQSVPTVGEEVNVGPVGDGPVLVAIPSGAATAGRAQASQKGLTFVPLTEARQIPVGSFLNTRRGTVELVSATGSGSRTQSGKFSAGLFQVLQSRARRARGLTELRLKGSSFKRCRRGRRGRSGAAQLSRRTVRRLRANARGRFRSRGRHSAATVRGTVWITADRCDGTLTTVRRGRVAVRDFRAKRTVILRRGKSYLARR